MTLIVGSPIFAQSFSGGLLLGVCGSQIDGDEQFKYKKPGLLAGAWVSRPISEYLDLKIETYYVGKGAVKNVDGPEGSVIQEFNTSLHYVEMPFLLNINVHTKIDVALGIAPSYLFAHKLTRYKQLVDKSLYDMNSFDYQGMGQIDLFLTEKLSSSLRLSYSIFDIRGEDVSTWYNNNFSIAFRYKIR